MTRTLNLTCELALAARAVSGLAARLNFATFVYEAAKDINILIVKALAIWAKGAGAAAHSTSATTSTAIILPFKIIPIVIIAAAGASFVHVTHGLDSLL